MTTESEPKKRATAAEGSAVSAERQWARRQLERKSKFRGDLFTYVAVNAFLVVVWALTGFGDFWPGWVMAGWAVFLLLDAVNIYYRRPITEDDVDRELRKRGEAGSKPRL